MQDSITIVRDSLASTVAQLTAVQDNLAMLKDDRVIQLAIGLGILAVIVATIIGGTSMMRLNAEKKAILDGKEFPDKLEAKQLHFAAVTLIGLGAFFFWSMGMYYYSTSQSGEAIFDATKTVVPPIVTLILGYYFGKGQ